MRPTFSILLLLFLSGTCSDRPDMIEYEIPDRISFSDSTDIKKLNDSISQIITHGNYTYNLVSSGGDSSDLEIEYDYFTLLDSIYKDSVNSFIVDLYTPYEYEGPVISANEVDDEFFKNYILGFAEAFYAYDDDMKDSEWGVMVWSLESSVSIDGTYSSFCQLEHSGWSYEGGAHGNGFWVVFQFDKSTGRKLKLEDFISDIDELTRIAEPMFRKQNGIGEEVSYEEAGYEFGENGFYLNDNFMISNGGLNFHYNSYEIGPYALPPSDLEIPLEEIKHLLVRDL